MEQFAALAQELRRSCPTLELLEEEPMSRHTSFHIGGCVKLMALPKSEAEAKAAVTAAARLGVEPFFMGNGSDLLVADGPIDVFIVKAGAGMADLALTAPDTLTAGSGALLSRAANFACERGLTGLEFAQGIPGSIGGAATMNAGAYGGEMAQVLRSVTCLTAEGEEQTLSGRELDLSYRHSAFSDGKRYILRAELGLKPGVREEILAEMKRLSVQRREKQPLEYPSGGSTFKRPDGHFAAALIDQCGLKGCTVGGAQVSEKHAGFVINRGGATCADVLELVAQIRARVLRETGVELELELKTLGVSPEVKR